MHVLDLLREFAPFCAYHPWQVSRELTIILGYMIPREFHAYKTICIYLVSG